MGSGGPPSHVSHVAACELTALRDAGFAFLMVGHGWYPGDVFADLRDRGLVAGPFQGFSWTTGGWSVRDDPPPPGTPSDPTADP